MTPSRPGTKSDMRTAFRVRTGAVTAHSVPVSPGRNERVPGFDHPGALHRVGRMAITTQTVEFPSNGGTASGYLAVPETGSGPGVVVVQEWWGLDPSIKIMVDRLAEAGFVA